MWSEHIFVFDKKNVILCGKSIQLENGGIFSSVQMLSFFFGEYVHNPYVLQYSRFDVIAEKKKKAHPETV